MAERDQKRLKERCLFFRSHPYFSFMAVAGLLYIIGISPVLPYGYDIFYQTRLGEVILQSHGIPDINPFSILYGAHIDIQCPTICILAYLIFGSVPGYAQLMGLKALAAVIAYTVVLLCIIRKDACGLEGVFCLFVSVLTVSAFADVRAIVISLAVLLIQTCVLSMGWDKDKPYLCIIASSFIMANLHPAMYLYVFIFEAPYLIQRLLIKRKGVFRLLLINIVALIAGGANPAGFKSLLWLTRTSLFEFKTRVPELWSLPTYIYFGHNTLVISGAFAYLAFFIICLHLTCRNGVLKNRAGDVLLGALLLVMALVFTRNVWYLPVGAVAMLQTFPVNENQEKFICSLLTVFMVLLAGTAYCQILSGSDYAPWKNYRYDADIADALESCGASDGSRVLTGTDIGSYLAARGYRVSCATMPEAEYKSMNGITDIREEQLNSQWPDFCRKYNLDYAVVPTCYIDYYDTLYGLCDRVFTRIHTNPKYTLYKVHISD